MKEVCTVNKEAGDVFNIAFLSLVHFVFKDVQRRKSEK